MLETWNRLEAWLQANTPWIYERLGPPATEEELRAAEEAMGWTLPEEFKESYRIHNGHIADHLWRKGRGAFWGIRPSGFLYDAEDFKRLDLITDDWRGLHRSRFPIVMEFPCNVEGPIKPESEYRSKIPIASAANLTYYLDMDPAEGGQVGQVIRYTYDDVRAIYVAPSYGSWLTMMAHALESKWYVFCPAHECIVPARLAR